MSSLIVNGSIILSLILGTYIVAIGYAFYVTRGTQNFSYQAEREFFAPLFNKKTTPKSPLDYFALCCFIGYIVFFLWFNFYDIGIKHFDSIFYIDASTCNADFIGPQLGWGSRFFPFGHQEFNLLAFPFAWLNCSYYFLFGITFIQLLITVFLLYQIIPFAKLWQKLFALLFIAINASFIAPFSTLIINDRNTLFLTILFLYCVIHFYKTSHNKYLIFALFTANTALYFKEPTFLFFSGFAATSMILKMISNKITPLELLKKPCHSAQKYPLEVSLLMLSLSFVSLYLLSLILFANPTIYGITDNTDSYLAYLWTMFLNYPLFPGFIIGMILIAVGTVKNFKIVQKHAFSLSLFSGGLLYALVVTSLRNTNEYYYYYCIAELAFILTACFYLKDLKLPKLWQILATIFIVFDLALTLSHSAKTLQMRKINQTQIQAYKENIPLDDQRISKVFLYKKNHIHANYYNSNVITLLKSIYPQAKIHLYIFQKCPPNVEDGNFKCLQTKQFIASDYDVIIFPRSFISKEKWQELSAQYGEQMQPITHFPKYLHAPASEYIYILYP